MDLEDEMMTVFASSSELLEAQAHIWNHIFSFMSSMSLKCAIQLGIPDAIHSHGLNPMPLSHLISALKLHPKTTPYIYRLMRLLIYSGFFATEKVINNGKEEDGYMLTKSSRLLLKDNPLTLTPFLLSMLEPLFVEPWQFLSAWFQNDNKTPFDTAYGMPFWEYVGRRPKDSEVFNAGMASDAKLVLSILLGKYKDMFDGLGSLVDVGGGTGTMAKAIAEAFPEKLCIVLDLPHVVANLKDHENLKYVGGDMFEAIPHADALLLKWILHTWDDEECVKILKKCKEAITNNEKKGKVIVIDIVIGNKKRDDMLIQTQLFFDMLLMTMAGGKERNEKEWAHLFYKAGFSDYKIFPILGLRSLIEIYP